jgi:hypothetical protein
MNSSQRSELVGWLKAKCTPVGALRLDQATDVDLVDRVLALTGPVADGWGESARVWTALFRVRSDASAPYDGSADQLNEIQEEKDFLAWCDEMDNRDRADGDFNEEDHPRDENGKFGEGGGSKADKKSKDPLVQAHAKIARDHAKTAVEHAQTVRAALKKDPTNVHLQELSKKADNTAKSARSSARKAEQAGSEKEAAKHAMAAGDKAKEAAGHVDKIVVAPVDKTKGLLSKFDKNGFNAQSLMSGLSPSEKTKLANEASAHANAQTPGTQAFANAHAIASQAHNQALTTAATKALKIEHASLTNEHGTLGNQPVVTKEATPNASPEAAHSMTLSNKANQATAKLNLNAHKMSHEDLVKEHAAIAQLHKEAHAAGVAAGFASTQTTNQHAQKELQHTTASKAEAPPPGVLQGHEFDQMRKEYSSKLNAHEEAAALKYSGNAYTEINSALRAGHDHSVTKHLDAAIDKAVTTKQITVFRGAHDTKGVFSSLKPGDKFHDKAYVSTSATHGFTGGVHFVITVPKGARAAPIPSKHPGEKEFLLPRNTSFKVTKSEKHPTGGHIIHMEMIHQ